MRTKLIFRNIIFALLLIINSCGTGKDVSVVNFNPQGKVENLTTFTIEFSQDLAPLELQDKWLDEEFVKFEPRIEGKFKWQSGNTLIFSPDNSLQPIQSYSAIITNRILFGKTLTMDNEEFKFSTPDFEALKGEFFWTHVPGDKYKVSVKAIIYFNYAVNPGMLKDYLSVEREGSEIKDYQIVTENASEVIAINIPETQQTNDEQTYKIKIRSGLISLLGKKGLAEEKVFKYDLPPVTELVITGVSSGMDGDKKWMEVFTTQTVDDKKIKSFIKVEPSKDLNFFVNENSFRIEGNFENAQLVNLKILKGLPGLYGGELNSEFEQSVAFTNLRPSIKFTDRKGKYLMLGGQRNIEAGAINVDGVDIEVGQVFKNNIVFFLKDNESSYYDEGDDSDYGYGYFYRLENCGRTLFKQSKKLNAIPNQYEKFGINLDKIEQEKLQGIFVVSVMSNADRWLRSTKLVSLTDLGIIAKKSDNELIVFVNSIATAEPVKDVEISLLSSNNQTLLTGKTNSKGIIRFENTKDNIKNFTPMVITAELNSDFNYIDLRETIIETSRFDVGGAVDFTSGYKTFIYGDRNLYRPGEQVNISGIVRDDNTVAVKNVPVLIKVFAPTGKVYEEFKKTLNNEGAFEISFKTNDFAVTGSYRVDVYSGSDNLIGTYSFNVENFVPDKLRVLLKNDKDVVDPGGKVTINIDAEYLFGAKASGLKWESDIQLRHKPFKSKSYPTFEFGNSSLQNPEIPNTMSNGTLDEQGKAKIEYNVPGILQSNGIITGYAFISVFDLSGRTVNRVSVFDIYPEKYFIGIKAPGQYFGTNENVNIKLVAVDKNDKPVSQVKADVKLVRLEWQTVLKKNYDEKYIYASEQKEIVEWTREVDLSGGEKNVTLNVSKSGKYELRVSRKGSSTFQRCDFWAYGWSSSTASSFEVNKEGKVDVVFDKQVYEPGEKAKILFTTPFAGKMLVSMERNGVYDYKYLEVKERSTQMELIVDSKYIPNVYITATLFKKHNSDQSSPFFVAHGIASMKVEKKSLQLPVSISSPAKVKPNSTAEIIVKTTPQRGIYVTLAAVDEGILQIKNYQTPDPYSFMYAKRTLNVSSYDLYKLLLPEIVMRKSSPGGDELARQLQKRANPLTNKRYNLVAYWSGILKSDDAGNVKVPLKIPQFNGEIRLMAVAYTNNRFGSSESRMKVSDDLIVESQMPRFLAPGDSLVMPVSLINTTGNQGKVTVNLKTEGPLKIMSSQVQSVNIASNATGKVEFIISADQNSGNGKIIIETSGIASVKEETNISVRPISPYYTETNSGNIKNDSEVKLNGIYNYYSNTVNSTIAISKFPALKFAKHLKYLVGYAYGCVEQTVSKLFPQLYYEDLAKLAAPEYYKKNNPVYFVKEGIKKLESMQLADGSLGYWPGDQTSNWWGSVYAAHFLVEAKKAGYVVSDEILTKLLSFLSKMAKEKSTFDYVWFNESNSRMVGKVANKEILYSLYVLAAAGRGDISTMNYYKSKPDLVTRDCKYLLAGAYALMNKWDSYYEVIPQNYSPEKTQRLSGGSFDSEGRSNAIMLDVLATVEPNNKQIPFIIKHLSDMLDNIYNTQERAFAFLGLGKSAKGSPFNDLKVEVIADDKTLGEFSGKDITLNIPADAKSIKLKGMGQGEVYYFQSTSGVKKSNIKERDSHLQVRRTYFDYATGNEIKNGRFAQGKLVVCKISLTGGEFSASNIAISDLIPSGFEIDNPRLAQVSKVQTKYVNTLNPRFMDIKDDRMILFTNAEKGTTKDFYYLIRAVNKGKFVLPVISAEGMYDGEINSVNGSGVIRIKE